jgi:hypothetical protein
MERKKLSTQQLEEVNQVTSVDCCEDSRRIEWE